MAPGFGKAAPQPLRQVQRIALLLQLLHQHHELITPQPGQAVGAAQHRLQAPGELQQQGVAGGMAMAVVHLLEAVQIAEDQGQGLVRLREGQFQPLGEAAAVEQPGEGITEGLGHQGLFAGPSVGHVSLHRHPVGEDTAGIGERCRLQFDPEGPAGAAVVQNLHLGTLPALQGLPEGSRYGQVGVGPLKQPRAAAEHLMQAIAGLMQHGIVGIHDQRPRCVHGRRQGDQQRILNRVQHRGQLQHQRMLRLIHRAGVQQADAGAGVAEEQAQVQHLGAACRRRRQLNVLGADLQQRFQGLDPLGQGWPGVRQAPLTQILGQRPQLGGRLRIDPFQIACSAEQKQAIAWQQQKAGHWSQWPGSAALRHRCSGQVDDRRRATVSILPGLSS